MKRLLHIFVPLVLAVVLLLCIALPASAASGIGVTDPSWFDYEVTPSSGGNYKATFTARSSDFYWERYLSGDVRYINSNSSEWIGQASQIRLLDNIQYRIYPFGYNNFIDFKGIALLSPEFHFSLNLNYISDPSASFEMKLTAYLYAYPGDGTGDIVHGSTGVSVVIPYDPEISTYTFDLTLEDDFAEWPDGVNTIPRSPVYYFEFVNLSDQTSTVQISYDLSASCSFDVICDQQYANYLLQLKGQGSTDQIIGSLGQVNDNLDGIQGSIDDTNENLDEIINGEVNPQSPDGADDFDDLISSEDALFEEVKQHFKDRESVFDDALSAFKTFRSSLEVILRILNLFLQLEFVRYLFQLSLSLGVLAVILNIGISAVESYTNRPKGKGKG